MPSAVKCVNELTEGMIVDFINTQASLHLSGDSDEWKLEELRATLVDACPAFEQYNFEALRELKRDAAADKLLDVAAEAYEAREQQLSPQILRGLERYVVLQIVDQFWKEHLHSMDVLRSGIFNRQYGQKDPFVEYKFEATKLFAEMTEAIKAEVTKFIFRVQVNFEAPPQQAPEAAPDAPQGYQSGSNPFIRSSGTKVQKVSRQDRRKAERDVKKGR
jgi:preprotein translocase subunit SecA